MKYSFLVFLGAASYGVLSTIAKLSYSAGFSPSDTTSGQMFFGLIILWLVVLIVDRKKTVQVYRKKDIVKLMFMGVPMAFTAVFYYKSVQLLPASIAILLLFQFTWIGILLESISKRKIPSLSKVGSIVVLFVGTILASNILESGLESFNKEGVIYGLLSSVSYALFIFFNGSTMSGFTAGKRSAWMLTGAVIVTMLVYPPYLILRGEISINYLTYIIPLALFGAVIPPFLFAIGIPKIGVGLSSIINATELPVAVIASSFLLGEVVVLKQWIGVFVILLAITIPYLIELRYQKK